MVIASCPWTKAQGALVAAGAAAVVATAELVCARPVEATRSAMAIAANQQLRCVFFMSSRSCPATICTTTCRTLAQGGRRAETGHGRSPVGCKVVCALSYATRAVRRALWLA